MTANLYRRKAPVVEAWQCGSPDRPEWAPVFYETEYAGEWLVKEPQAITFYRLPAAQFQLEFESALTPLYRIDGDTVQVVAEERFREALTKIAAYDDERASKLLELTGSYGGFDEPGSAQIARAALEQPDSK